MGKVEAETCSVCQENASKYRCPGCGAPYCSLACNKLHKSGTGGNPPCSGKRSLSVQAAADLNASQDTDEASPAKRSRVGNAGENNASDNDTVEEAGTAVCIRQGRDQWRGGREDREEEEWQMSADQRERITGCKWLKAALRDPKLQGLLTEIDQARDREKALAFHRTSTQFGEFMDKLLLEIGEYRKGGVDEPELVAADP